ncbi:hypothetical protein NX794_30955 [Streptomyces sp. LP11]|uniref:Transposase n=1 Tax=Streptomyces pyxinicus TaxID=2970331 RepID=A0ABT2BAP9_9ACTN|nr:hypothetical protein [Streptomyces sp. LP11]MCS0605590.1 hypothetical protein [Streptomyces sp. LP11]
MFDAAAVWLCEGRVLLPGVSRLARLVGPVRKAANQRLWDTLYGMLGVGQRAVLDSLLTVPPGECLGAGPAAQGPGAGVGPADEAGAGTGGGDRRARDGSRGRVGDTAAQVGGAVAVRGGREGVAAAPALRRPSAGYAAGHHGLLDLASGGRRAGGADRDEAAGEGGAREREGEAEDPGRG